VHEDTILKPVEVIFNRKKGMRENDDRDKSNQATL
jgi:hypothetical protein